MSCASANCSLRRSVSSSNLREEKWREGGGGREGGEREGETGNSHLVTDPLHSYLLVFSELLLKANVQLLQFALQWKNHWTSHDAAAIAMYTRRCKLAQHEKYQGMTIITCRELFSSAVCSTSSRRSLSRCFASAGKKKTLYSVTMKTLQCVTITY